MGFFRFLFSIPMAFVLGIVSLIPMVGSFVLFFAVLAWAHEAGLFWGFLLAALIAGVVTMIALNTGSLVLVAGAVALVTLLWGIGV